MFQARPENGIPTVIPQMYLPGAHPRLKRDRRRRDGWRREGGRNAAVNVSSPINIVPRAFCPPVPRVFRHIFPSLPTPSLFIAETHTVSYCASNFCMRHSRVSVVPRTIIMPPQQALVKRALYCCSRCSDAASFLRPDARLLRLAPSLVRAVSICPCPSSTRSHKPKIHNTPRARFASRERTAPAPRIIASNYFWFRFQPWWENVVNPLREITRESKRRV